MWDARAEGVKGNTADSRLWKESGLSTGASKRRQTGPNLQFRA